MRPGPVSGSFTTVAERRRPSADGHEHRDGGRDGTCASGASTTARHVHDRGDRVERGRREPDSRRAARRECRRRDGTVAITDADWRLIAACAETSVAAATAGARRPWSSARTAAVRRGRRLRRHRPDRSRRRQSREHGAAGDIGTGSSSASFNGDASKARQRERRMSQPASGISRPANRRRFAHPGEVRERGLQSGWPAGGDRR